MSVPRSTTGPNGGGFARSAGAAAGRGVLLVVFALAIGVLLLGRALDDGEGGRIGAGPATDTTAPPTETTAPPAETTAPPATEPPVTHPPAQVRVLVLNGRAVQGIAGANNEVLLTQNFNTLSPGNTPSTVPETQVAYVDPAFAPDAVSIANILGIPPERAVQADVATELGVDTMGANVVVVLGTDMLGSVSA